MDSLTEPPTPSTASNAFRDGETDPNSEPQLQHPTPTPPRTSQQTNQHQQLRGLPQSIASFPNLVAPRAQFEAPNSQQQQIAIQRDAQRIYGQIDQAIHHYHMQTNGMNGMNGAGPGMPGAAAGAGAAMTVGPTPAGHQAELNIIYGMVEELSRQLAENRRVTEDIVNGLGRVRNRARERGMGNDEVLGEAADEIFSQEPNLEALLSVLTESLDRAKYSRDANFALLTNYARVLSTLLSQFHAYKQKHIADVSAWHRSYRSQLAEARAENSRLREQIWDMQEHAGKANALLRELRKKYDEDEVRNENRVDDRAKRQEIRFWKRLAMPDVGEEGIWSDDDDIVDPVEKERLKEVERKVAEQALAGVGSTSSRDDGDESEGSDEGLGQEIAILGGVPMERDGSGSSGLGMLPPPPRPLSANSTGSSGGQTG